MTLVWGVPLIERAGGGHRRAGGPRRRPVPRCVDERFTLLAPDDYRGDYLDVKLWDGDGRELARESLYVEDDEDDD